MKPTHDPLALGATWSDAGLSDADYQRALAAGRALGAELGQAEALAPFAEQVWRSDFDAPILYLDDFSAIPFLDNISGVAEYQHRTRVRAGEGDLFAAISDPAPGYEDYCRERLQLGSPTFLLADPPPCGLRVAKALQGGAAFELLAAVASDGLALHPYMGIEDVWALARALAERSGGEVRVLGPPPPATWVANDKGVFSRLVSGVLGPEFVVETHGSNQAAELAKLLQDLATRHERVALKRTRCASGMGNWHLSAQEVREHTALADRVERFLFDTRWDGVEQVLAMAWEPAEHSPSTQLWIPSLEGGPPRLDGIYEQILVGELRVFQGSRPAGFPRETLRQIAATSLQVGAALQALGYVGRCSFDLLLLGDPAQPSALRFTESNGRWGGTSTPMHLVDRLIQGPRPPYRAQDFVHPGLIGATFPEVAAKLGDRLYDPRTGEGRYVLYNVGPLQGSGKLDVIAFGDSQDEAEALLADEFPRLLGVE
ncbi:MAG: hypothetical protein KDD82_04495 [Planctomycetes bacterium]|nr:hypothetical protein [Planctomycetota bacterium]